MKNLITKNKINTKMEELFEMYKKLDIKDRIRFDREYIKFSEEEKLKQLTKKKEIVENINAIVNEENQPYFSSVWIRENISM